VSLPLYDLRKSEDLTAALQDLRGFWKFWSACLLQSCGLPTLQGIIVTRKGAELREPLHRFLSELGATAALIRHDKRPEAPPVPRGGFLVREQLLSEAMHFFFDLDRIVAVYEPADPLLNGYNANFLFETKEEISVEVVGPGFDASDLQRGDLSPHESFSVSVEPEGIVSKIKLERRVDQSSYEKSVAARKVKIWEKLNSAPAKELAVKIRKDLGIPDDLESYLRTIGSPLSKNETYCPISPRILRKTITDIIGSDVIDHFAKVTGARFPLVFSSSWVYDGRKQIFWDIVSPTLKYQGVKEKIRFSSPNIQDFGD